MATNIWPLLRSHWGSVPSLVSEAPLRGKGTVCGEKIKEPFPLPQGVVRLKVTRLVKSGEGGEEVETSSRGAAAEERKYTGRGVGGWREVEDRCFPVAAPTVLLPLTCPWWLPTPRKHQRSVSLPLPQVGAIPSSPRGAG